MIDFLATPRHSQPVDAWKYPTRLVNRLCGLADIPCNKLLVSTVHQADQAEHADQGTTIVSRDLDLSLDLQELVYR